ncbi:uncharacterized protein LOC106161887 [Lingula anatina]|uniref:Uncharacterized protein LOC106161887 n=1 Tax=Lingula anatina TaxID=7574 RepID=A0A1S3I829_LINAN|nr:uncharacterized protein LOC106161887 [Lingula anatina]|eukprot:XP_013394412.1 uncharacterized protein LOC106161887 [Lingula anatina]
MPSKPEGAQWIFNQESKEPYCPGYLDRYGVWNNGFSCPELDPEPEKYCCGSQQARYCCPPPSEAPQPEGFDLLENIPVLASIIAGGVLIVIVMTLIFCYWCSCCYIHKKHRNKKDTARRNRLGCTVDPRYPACQYCGVQHHPFQYVCDAPPPYCSHPGSTVNLYKDKDPNLNGSCTVFKNEKFFEVIKEDPAPNGPSTSRARSPPIVREGRQAAEKISYSPELTPLPLNLSFSSFMQSWPVGDASRSTSPLHTGQNNTPMPSTLFPWVQSNCTEDRKNIFSSACSTTTMTSSFESKESRSWMTSPLDSLTSPIDSLTSPRNSEILMTSSPASSHVDIYLSDAASPIARDYSFTSSDFTSYSTLSPSSDYCAACNICSKTDHKRIPPKHRIETEYVTCL